MPPPLTWTIVTSMCSLAILVWGLFALFTWRSQMETAARKRFGLLSGVYLLGWLLLSLSLGSGGIFQAGPSTEFPVIALGIVVPILLGALLLRRSTLLNTAIESIPLPGLIGIQLYRAFGFIFLALYAIGKLPAEFAIPAGVGDVLVGLCAPAVGYALFKGYRRSCLAALAWNLAGIADLVIAVTLGFLSSPGPFQTVALDSPNELITAFPLVLVPTFAVPLSVLLHLAALKRLRVVAGNSSEGANRDNRPPQCATRSAAP